MKNLYFFIFFFVVLATVFKPSSSFAQIDTRFWFAAPDISASYPAPDNGGHGDRPILLRFSAFDKPATIVISMPADPAFVPIVLNLAAFASISQDLTSRIALIETPRLNAGFTKDSLVFRDYTKVHPSGLLVESTAKITAYYEVNFTNNPDIFALKGENGLGTDFYVPMQTAWNNKTGLRPRNGHAGVVIVATEDNTSVTVYTKKATRSFPYVVATPNGTAAGTLTKILNKGEAWNVATFEPTAGNNIAGSRITSTKPIAVTVFHDSIVTSSGGCYDLAGDQLVPTNIIGSEYIVMRGQLGRKNDGTNGVNQPERVYILATQNTTVNVNIEGVAQAPVNLVAGQQHQITLDTLQLRAYINATQPVYVLHMSGYGCETGAAILPPISCTGSKLVQFNRSSAESFSTTIMVKTGGEGNFLVNGVALPSAIFTPVPGTAGVWKSARLTYNNYTAIVSGTTIPAGTNKIENTTNLFHLGITNGGESSGCRYGYFSSFNSLNLGPDINIFYGSNIILDATTFGANSYSWTPDLQTTAQITVNARKTENYTVTVDIGGCLLNATICVGTIEYIWTGFQDTNYNNINNWSRPCGVNVVPDCSRDVIIPDSVNGAKTPRYPDLNNITVACRNLIIEKGAALNFTGTGQINVCGDMIHSGFLNMPQATNTLMFFGTKPQLYTRTATGTGEFANLRINNQTTTDPRIKVSAGGAENMIVSSFGTLNLDRGFIITEGTKEVVVKNKAINSIIGYGTGANSGNGKFVAGRLRRYINTLGSYDLPVGLATETVSAPVAQAGKRATMVGTVSNALNWPTNTLNCTPNPFVNNHSIALNDNNAPGNATSTALTNKQHIQLPISVGISGNNLRTIEGWFKTTINQSSGGALFYMGTPALKQLFALRKGAGINDYRIDVGGGFGLDFTVPGINNGGWHHFAMTYDGVSVEVYTDGLFRVSLAVDLNTNLGNFYVGRYVDDVGRNWYLKGEYDNIRVWNTARTADEIQLNICSYYECVTPSNLIADYDMEDGYGFVDFKTRNCSVSLLQYERAKVEFQTPMTTADNLLAFFNKYPSLPLSSPVSYACQANFGSCDVLDHGFWTISAFNNATQVSGGSTFYRMTFYNNAYSVPSCSVPKATIMKRATSAAAWAIPTFPTLCYDNSLASTAMEYMTGFSDFGVPTTLDPVILPVDLISLTAKPLSTSILVEWKTVNEIDNTGFEVWRSTDTENFVKVGWVAQNSLNVYEFEDKEVTANQMYYYYLKQIDNTGNAKTSKVVNAKIDGSMEGGINVYPNPTENNFIIDLGETYTANSIYQIEIYTSIGMLVKSKTITNSSKINMSLEGLAKGMYLIKVITPSRTKFVKLQKE